ncbi:MAG: hypothetical protein PF689_00385 [Deltaproteobacteria bacterium]|jgi:hypothetical protein|nr:hypothetical protein [Deltaproteobacteria bacterium]
MKNIIISLIFITGLVAQVESKEKTAKKDSIQQIKDPQKHKTHVESIPVYNKFINKRTKDLRGRPYVSKNKQDKVTRLGLMMGLGFAEENKLRSEKGNRGRRVYTGPKGDTRIVDPNKMPKSYITKQDADIIAPRQSHIEDGDLRQAGKSLLDIAEYDKQETPGIRITKTPEQRKQLAHQGLRKYLTSTEMIHNDIDTNVGRRTGKVYNAKNNIYANAISPEEKSRRNYKAKFVRKHLPSLISVKEAHDLKALKNKAKKLENLIDRIYILKDWVKYICKTFNKINPFK